MINLFAAAKLAANSLCNFRSRICQCKVTKQKNRIIVENVVRNHGYNINTIMFVDYWASVDDVRFGASAEETGALLASCETCESSKVFGLVGTHLSSINHSE